MNEKKNILICGVGENGYGGALLEQLKGEKHNVFVVGRNPTGEQFQKYINENEATLIEHSGEMYPDNVDLTLSNYQKIGSSLEQQLNREPLDAVIQTQAGFGKVLQDKDIRPLLLQYRKLEIPFKELPQKIIDAGIQIYAESHLKMIEMLHQFGILGKQTRCVSFSFDEEMPGYPHELKRLLEYRMYEIAQKNGLNTLAIALPKADTPATKEFRKILDIFILKEFLDVTMSLNFQNNFTALLENFENLSGEKSGTLETIVMGIYQEISEFQSGDIKNEIQKLFGDPRLPSWERSAIDNLNPIFTEGLSNLISMTSKEPVKSEVIRITDQISFLVKKEVSKILVHGITSGDSDWGPGNKRRITYKALLDPDQEEKCEIMLPVMERPSIAA
ncbi:hypothetical protein K9L27_04075 [Candidatus Gracilibacteria bacterium]|nr:hypothetical protein [Candidatus Gracilibacteria bacterium]